jgi:hypothetical protein
MLNAHSCLQVEEPGRVNAFSYENQYTSLLPKRVTVHQGDVMSTSCVYNSSERQGPTKFGLASLEEMCLGSLLVHPKECREPLASSSSQSITIHAASSLISPLFASPAKRPCSPATAV